MSLWVKKRWCRFFFCIQFKTLRVKYCKLTFYLCEILKWIWHCSLEHIADWKICHFLRFLLCVCVCVCINFPVSDEHECGITNILTNKVMKQLYKKCETVFYRVLFYVLIYLHSYIFQKFIWWIHFICHGNDFCLHSNVTKCIFHLSPKLIVLKCTINGARWHFW